MDNGRLHHIQAKANDGSDQSLEKYAGKALLIVNTASECGYTPQYKGLQALYERYRARGFEVLAFPSNDFGAQEPGSDAEIKQFCTSKYNVTFPMTSKISVKGDDKHPLYQFLTEGKVSEEFGGDIEWNFAKFLVDRNGNVMARFGSRTAPDAPPVAEAVEKALAAGPAKASARAE